MQNIALGDYPVDFISRVQTLGGKLGVLQFLRENGEIRDFLQGIGIHIAPGLQIVKNNTTLDGVDLDKLGQDSENASGFDTRPFFIIRGSVPGDFRSLVDVIPTQSYPIRNIRNAMLHGIQSILEDLEQSTSDIKRYAAGMGVPYDGSDVQIGVAPYFHVPILTATEHPNDEGTILLDTFFGNYDFGGHNITAINYNPDYTTDNEDEKLKRGGFSISGNNKLGKKIEAMLQYLRKNGVLDPTVAYQFEFGVENETLLLFQVREFCRKYPKISPVSEHLKKSGRAVFCALEEGESLQDISVVTGEYHEPWEKLASDPNEKKRFLLAGRRAPKLFTNEYDARIIAQFHTDVGGGSMNHDSFRTAQSVMQSGGVVGLGYAYIGHKCTLEPTVTIKREGSSLEIGERVELSNLGGKRLQVPLRKK